LYKITNHEILVFRENNKWDPPGSTLGNFPLTPTPLEIEWMLQARNIPTFTLELSLKYLHKLILHNIFEENK
jgi:hypothetical protein